MISEVRVCIIAKGKEVRKLETLHFRRSLFFSSVLRKVRPVEMVL
jgi:hypothetical protein